MKKIKYAILGVVLVLSCASCGNNNSGTDSGAYKPSIMYDDVLYSLTLEKPENLKIRKEELEYVGTVEEVISGTELPTKNFQANGNSELQNCDIYYSDSYPEYLFVFHKEDYVIYAR